MRGHLKKYQKYLFRLILISYRYRCVETNIHSYYLQYSKNDKVHDIYILYLHFIHVMVTSVTSLCNVRYAFFRI